MFFFGRIRNIYARSLMSNIEDDVGGNTRCQMQQLRIRSKNLRNKRVISCEGSLTARQLR